ncbi:MAG: hypothetical protein IKT00_13395 [Prevotella sp.]|nr:hypothetical protein [Prevotella sp.]
MRKTIGIINMILGAIIAISGSALSVMYLLTDGSKVHYFILYLILWLGLGVLLFLIGNNFRKSGNRRES